MTNDDVLKIYEETNALLKGHFRLSSGRHSDRYLQSALVLQYPWHAEAMGKALGEKVKSLGVQVVVSPAMGGLFIGHELARALKVKHIFTERNKDTDAMELRRGFTIEKGEKFFAVEDIITTAKSVKETIKVIEGLGGVLAGVGCLIDRTGGEVEKNFAVPVKSLAALKVESWEEADCPLCKKGQPVIKPGSRAKF